MDFGRKSFGFASEVGAPGGGRSRPDGAAGLLPLRDALIVGGRDEVGGRFLERIERVSVVARPRLKST